ncbi:MAG: 50S ribosomal protein L1 [Acidobacteria bacterium]|jgi:large subunit ribosomal protein L1|nr:50S ribosomal protein L1 [Acidobacteriota bacterium]
MGKIGKKYKAAAALIEAGKSYPISEAVGLLKKVAYAQFDETVELTLNLGVNPKYADQMVRGTTVLPNGLGKKVRVLVIAQGEKIKEAEAAGADYAMGEEAVAKIQGGWLDFDAMIATPDMMKEVGKLGKVLGPRGLMPNPKLGTVTFDLSKAISDLKAGKVEFRVDKAGIIHCPLGKKSFSEEQINGNLTALLEAVARAKPAAAKGKYMKSAYLSTTMSPSIRLDVSAF